jgi:type VI secretion system protein ImpJ
MDVPTTSIRRFEPVKGRETFDETIGTGDVVVDRQRVKLSLHTDGTLPSGYPSLPLLAVRRNATGMVELAPYHPPLLRIGASSFLAEQGLERQFLALRDAMWEKIAQLVGVTGEDVPESLAALGTEARSHLHAARTIAACLPLIDAVLSDPLTSPAQAWNTMAQIVGRMAAIGSDPRPLAMDPYRHDDCQPHFQAALAFVQRKLGLIRTAWDSMAFDRIGEGVFSRRLPEDMHGPVLIELRIGEGQTAAGMLDWLQHARIGSDDLLPVLRQRRVPGAEVRALGKEEIATLGLRADLRARTAGAQRGAGRSHDLPWRPQSGGARRNRAGTDRDRAASPARSAETGGRRPCLNVLAHRCFSSPASPSTTRKWPRSVWPSPKAGWVRCWSWATSRRRPNRRIWPRGSARVWPG